MFSEELERPEEPLHGPLLLYHVLSDDLRDVELFNGVLDQQKCADFLRTVTPSAEIDEAFIRGPPR